MFTEFHKNLVFCDPSVTPAGLYLEHGEPDMQI